MRLKHSILAHPLAAPLASAMLAIILFAPVIGHGYLYDAAQIIQRDTRLADPWFGLKVWISQWWPEGSAVPLSRPVPQFTFWLQAQLHGTDLAAIGQSTVNWFLVVDLLLYAILCATVAHLTRRWLSIGADVSIINHKSAIINSYLVGLAFAAHPIHTEIVASSVGRADTLALLFTLFGILLWLRWRLEAFTWRRAVVIGLCVLAAGLSKENGYLLAPMLVLIEMAQRRRENRPLFMHPAAPRLDVPWRVVVAILIVVVVAVSQREISKYTVEDMLITRPPDIDNPLVIATPDQRVVTPFKVFGKAVQLIGWPLVIQPRVDDPDLPPIRPANSPDYSPRMLMPTDQWTDPLVLLGVITAAGWLAAVAFAWRKRHPALGPLLIVPVAWAIPSNTFFLIGTILGERLILPLSCFALIAVVGWIPWTRMKLPGRALARLVSVVYVAVLATATILYLPAWRSNEELQGYTVSFHPLSGRFQSFFAVSLLIDGIERPDQRRMFFDLAEHHARLALEYWPRNDQPYSVLGVIAHHRGNEEAAQRYLQYGRRGGRWNISDDYLAKIGQAEQQTELKKRADQLQQQLDADPDNGSVQLELAAVYTQLKEHAKAIRLYDEAVDIASESDFSILELYLEAALVRGTHEQVQQLIHRQLELRPDQWSVLTDTAILVILSGTDDDLEQARQWLQRAAELSPGSPEPWAGLSLWYERKGDKKMAIEMLQQALDRSSRDDPKWVHYQLRMEQLWERR